MGKALANDVRRVGRLVSTGKMEEAGGVAELRHLIGKVDEQKARLIQMLENATELGLCQYRRAKAQKAGEDELAACYDKLAVSNDVLLHLRANQLLDFARDAKEAANDASESYAESVIGDELEDVLYARAVNHYWQDGDDGDDLEY